MHPLALRNEWNRHLRVRLGRAQLARWLTEAPISVGTCHLRIARPVDDLERGEEMYRRGLGLRVLGRFENHAGFDGVMLGEPGASYHLELTRSRDHPVRAAPTPEDLLVFYIPGDAEWRAACADMAAAGFVAVEPHNPYWAERGRTFEDLDGYRVVLERSDWRRAEGSTRARVGPGPVLRPALRRGSVPRTPTGDG